MTNPKKGSTLTSWQLISIGAVFLAILGLSSCGSQQKSSESNTSQPQDATQQQNSERVQSQGSVKPNQSSSSSSPQDDATQKLIGQWQSKETSSTKEKTYTFVFGTNNKLYFIEDETFIEGSEGSYKVDTTSKPEKIITKVGFGTPTFELVNTQQLKLIDVQGNTISIFQKISDKETLPDGTKFAKQDPRASQSEARNNLGVINRAQQAFRLENVRFASKMIDLGIGIPEEGKNYKYTIAIVDEKRMVWFIATPKANDLKNYIGITKLISENNQTFTRSVACESLQPTTNVAPKPSNAGRETDYPACPDGYRDLSN